MNERTKSIIDSLKNPDNGAKSMRVTARGTLCMSPRAVTSSKKYKEMIEVGRRIIKTRTI